MTGNEPEINFAEKGLRDDLIFTMPKRENRTLRIFPDNYRIAQTPY